MARILWFTGTGCSLSGRVNPASNRGIWCLKGAKRSPLTKWKCWKSWAKATKAVIGCPSECQKQRDFQGGLDVDEKGGGGRGGQKCRISGKTRLKLVKGGLFRAHFGQNRASLGAFEFILIESMLESGPKRPHSTARMSQDGAEMGIRAMQIASRTDRDGLNRDRLPQPALAARNCDAKYAADSGVLDTESSP